MNILVTGGNGFIGSHFIEEIISDPTVKNIINVDCMTYAANKNLSFQTNRKYQHFKFDISKDSVYTLLNVFEIDSVVHFAAESHVDNSIINSAPFMKTNVIGTHNLLNDLLSYKKQKDFKFIHISTDEVFGSLSCNDPAFTVGSPYQPNSPYAASKASSDLIVRSFFQTYKFPAIITNCSNNFGARQNREKLIPKCIYKLMNKQSIPIYGSGQNIRDWIYVKDHVRCIWQILNHGRIGKQYLLGGNNELSNLELINIIKDVYEEITNESIDYKFIDFVEDRKGHDFRYAINNESFLQDFPNFKLTNFQKSIKETVMSYLNKNSN